MSLFAPLLQAAPLVRNREVLRPSFVPEELPHREQEIERLARALLPALQGERPRNVVLTGKTGVGKTSVARFVAKELQKAAGEREQRVAVVYLDCSLVDTHYRVLTHIANHFITNWNERIPFTGWPTSEVLARLQKEVAGWGGAVVLILDRVDDLVRRAGEAPLRDLVSVAAESNARVCLVGIARDLTFLDYVDPSLRTLLMQEERINFQSYEPPQVEDVLRHRSVLAFREGALAEGVVEACVKASGNDATRALEILRVAGEVAEQERASSVRPPHVVEAHQKVLAEGTAEIVRVLPLQSKLVLLAIVLGEEAGVKGQTTGEAFDSYRELCQETHVDVLTMRRVTDLISELAGMGLVGARVISKGRYGRSKEILLTTPIAQAKAALAEDAAIEPILGRPLARQARLD